MAELIERSFLSLKEFYAANPKRELSGEVDFGVMWGDRWPRYRISWIKDTGEVYAFEQGPSGHVVVLGYARSRPEVEGALSGWVDNCDRGPAWVESRLREWNRRYPDSIPEAFRG